MSFEKAADLGDLWSGEMVGTQVRGRPVLLARVGDLVYAYADRCGHLGLPLSRGTLAGTRLVCSAHLWEYDVVTGRGINPATACLHRFPVRIEQGVVLVDVEEGR
jgi:toluene monooxygenase system ferredoxin subunit